ncbi:MAG: hypothetical protein WED05_11140 [Candidatus Atabeyarchaeum deiterrae]
MTSKKHSEEARMRDSDITHKYNKFTHRKCTNSAKQVEEKG